LTVKQPSGVALLVNVGGRWRCAGLAPSYQQFEKLADGEPANWDLKPTGRRPDPNRLLAVCHQLLDGGQVSLIAMDMPLSREPITGDVRQIMPCREHSATRDAPSIRRLLSAQGRWRTRFGRAPRP